MRCCGTCWCVSSTAAVCCQQLMQHMERQGAALLPMVVLVLLLLGELPAKHLGTKAAAPEHPPAAAAARGISQRLRVVWLQQMQAAGVLPGVCNSTTAVCC